VIFPFLFNIIQLFGVVFFNGSWFIRLMNDFFKYILILTIPFHVLLQNVQIWLLLCGCDSFFLPFRKFNMSCCQCMQPNYLKKITLDAMHCLEMTRYWVITLLFKWFCTRYLKIKQLLLLSYLFLSGLMMSKVEDLSRMFRLFSKIPRGLDPVSSIFKQVSCFQLSVNPFLF
jgi:hypothetical protein